jgi:hypothetical protein
MIIGKTMSNIGWEIENQYEILSQMISDVAEHYQKEAIDLDLIVDAEVAKEPEDDYDAQLSKRNEYREIVIKKSMQCAEARKVLFCAIFSYFESMLYGIIEYYKIPRGKTIQVKQLVDIIKNEYVKRYNDQFPDYGYTETIICEQYRILRNYFMHGKLDSDNDMESLRSYVLTTSGISWYDWDRYEITDNNFLIVALGRINGFLVRIEEAYNNKSRTH